MVEYTAQDVAQHNVPESHWIILHGKVYDVTSYLDDHPGGKDVLIESAGKDATEDFEFAGHSQTAKDSLQSFLIGSLAGYTQKKSRLRLAALFPSKGKEAQRQQLPLPSTNSKPKLYLSLILFVGIITLISRYERKYEMKAMFNNSGFWTGVSVALTAVGSAGWYGFHCARKALFPGEEVFSYPPYY